MSSKSSSGRRKKPVEELPDWDQIIKSTDGRDVSWKDFRDRCVEAKAHNHRKHEKPLTERHIQYIEAIETHPVTICTGPAGTGKTALACDVAAKFLKSGYTSKIILTRPLIQCDEDVGTLPGDIGEKLNPYLAPLSECLKECLGPNLYEKMLKNETIQIVPLGFMRGRTFHDCTVILDESQNATFGQLKMFFTRMGYNSRMVVNGDISQADINTRGKMLPLLDTIERLQGIPDIAIVSMTREDVLRPPLIQLIDERMSS